jgi:hypothetical protein
VATVAKSEPLHPIPATAYPAVVAETRTASRQALVSYRGNRYNASESGKYIGHHSTAPQKLEVLFKSGTNFMVGGTICQQDSKSREGECSPTGRYRLRVCRITGPAISH